MPAGIGWQELLIVLVIIALVFGASRVADLGGALGRGIREFRQEAAKPDDNDEAETTSPSSAVSSSGESGDDSSDPEQSG